MLQRRIDQDRRQCVNMEYCNIYIDSQTRKRIKWQRRQRNMRPVYRCNIYGQCKRAPKHDLQQLSKRRNELDGGNRNRLDRGDTML